MNKYQKIWIVVVSLEKGETNCLSFTERESAIECFGTVRALLSSLNVEIDLIESDLK